MASRRPGLGGIRPRSNHVRLRPEDTALFLRDHPDEPMGPLLLCSFDGDDSEQRRDRAGELIDGAPGSAEHVAHWWEHRNDAVEEFRKVMAGEGLLGPHGMVDTIEVAGSWTVLRDLYHSVKEGPLGGRSAGRLPRLSRLPGRGVPVLHDGLDVRVRFGSRGGRPEVGGDRHAGHARRRWHYQSPPRRRDASEPGG